MSSAQVLKPGIFIDYGCSQITPIEDGVFIPFSYNGGPSMTDLDSYLRKYHGVGLEEHLLVDQFLAIIEKHGLQT